MCIGDGVGLLISAFVKYIMLWSLEALCVSDIEGYTQYLLNFASEVYVAIARLVTGFDPQDFLWSDYLIVLKIMMHEDEASDKTHHNYYLPIHWESVTVMVKSFKTPNN